MSEKIILLKRDEVVSINDSKAKVVVSHKTFKAGELLNGLLEKMDHDAERRSKWTEGVDCEILSLNHG